MSEITSTSHNNYCCFQVSNALNQMSNLCLSQPNYNLSLPIRAVIHPYFRDRSTRQTEGWRKVSHILYMTDLHAMHCGEQLCSSNNSSLSLHSGIYSTAVCLGACIYIHNISEPIFPPYILVPILDITTGYTVQLCVCVHVHVYTHNISM